MKCGVYIVFLDLSMYSLSVYYYVESVDRTISRAYTFMREQSHLTTLYHLKPIQYCVNVLRGVETDDENEQMMKAILANKNPHQLFVL